MVRAGRGLELMALIAFGAACSEAASSSTPAEDAGLGGGGGGRPDSAVGSGGSGAGGSGMTGGGGSSDRDGASDGAAWDDARDAANADGNADGNAGAQPFKGVANSPCAARTALNVSWYYNWTQSESEPCSGGQGGEFVPMVWGKPGAEQSAGGIQSAVVSFVGMAYGHVLGFNEPDNTGQANISVATAITLLPSFDNPSILVGTPATSANGAGQDWFKDYMGQVNASTSLRADFIAIHWYGWNAGSCDANASQLESYLNYAEGFPGNRPIWLTEWGCLNQSAPTVAGVVDFYRGAVAVFARHPRVQRYAWFPWSTNCELNKDDGTLTDLGVAYAAAAATR